jgi:hypothetical protein
MKLINYININPLLISPPPSITQGGGREGVTTQSLNQKLPESPS